MKSTDPVDSRIRLAISQWPDDAPRGSVTTFCIEHNLSRNTFYKILKRSQLEGPAAALEPLTRRPHNSPNQLTNEVKQDAIDVRHALERSGLDHGPISVHDKMKQLNLDPPSVAALARIFREAGVARAEPKKKPRAAYRRFVYPAPNCLWQLDATEYVLSCGRKCTIFQLIDDHSRLAIASHVTTGETADGALAVMKKGIKAYGVPQRLLTDNGVALNPTRRGFIGKLVAYVTSLGVEAITGKPGKPTTQGKNERFHQTLFRWLDHQPLADSIAQMQALVDEFDVIYNTQRPHQGLPGRITPAKAWELTATAAPPKPQRFPVVQTIAEVDEAPTPRFSGSADGEAVRTVGESGRVSVLGTQFSLGKRFERMTVHVIWDELTVKIFAEDGTHLMTYPRPPYAGLRKVPRSQALALGVAFG